MSKNICPVFSMPMMLFFHRVVYEPLIITSSCLQSAAKKSVRLNLCTLGAHIVNEWTKDCTLLVMNNISVTVKVRTCILDVTINFCFQKSIYSSQV